MILKKIQLRNSHRLLCKALRLKGLLYLKTKKTQKYKRSKRKLRKILKNKRKNEALRSKKDTLKESKRFQKELSAIEQNNLLKISIILVMIKLKKQKFKLYKFLCLLLYQVKASLKCLMEIYNCLSFIQRRIRNFY